MLTVSPTAELKTGENTPMRWTPRKMKAAFRFFAPYVGAKIKVTNVAEDWSAMSVRMDLGLFNRNYFGNHFGGSLYSMVDPHYVLLLSNLLGPGYVVTDKSATIEYFKPGKGPVFADFHVPEKRLNEIKEDAESGSPILPEFDIEIKDSKGETVAGVRKILYVRKKSNPGG